MKPDEEENSSDRITILTNSLALDLRLGTLLLPQSSSESICLP
ncbi:MAG: hypothetical protein QNJ53_18130 [Pleurocapsa sp. MO_192.B19]|nr:hypothetical protein [Pleurocapsa sp. MO_192.B19]